VKRRGSEKKGGSFSPSVFETKYLFQPLFPFLFGVARACLDLRGWIVRGERLGEELVLLLVEVEVERVLMLSKKKQLSLVLMEQRGAEIDFQARTVSKGSFETVDFVPESHSAIVFRRHCLDVERRSRSKKKKNGVNKNSEPLFSFLSSTTSYNSRSVKASPFLLFFRFTFTRLFRGTLSARLQLRTLVLAKGEREPRKKEKTRATTTEARR